MARKHKGNPINGWVVIDKPAGVTSIKVVSKARWAFQAGKAGHAGTLDPLATGVLAIAFGEATKTVALAQVGLWRFSDGTLAAVAAVGPPSPAEYVAPLATAEVLAPLVKATGGKVAWLNDGVPEMRLVAEGRRAYSRRWIAFKARDAYRVTAGYA